MSLFILCLVWNIVGVWSQEVNVTCSMSPVKPLQGDNVVLTYHFSPNLKEFTIYHYIANGSSDAIVDCWRIKGILDCFIKPRLQYNKTVNTQLAVTILNVTSVDTGRYAFQIAGYGPTQSGTCELKSMDFTGVKSNGQDKTGMDFTGVKSNGQDKTADEESSTLVIVLISSLLSVAGVVAVVVILLLIYKRKCVSSSQGKDDVHQESTPILPKASIMEKEKEERTKLTNNFQDSLEKAVKDMYPDMTRTFYFVPPVYFNKTRYRQRHVAGEEMWVPDSPTENDVRHDQAMQHVIHCLRHLAEHRQERMFVVTQLTFDAYLNNGGTDYVKHRLPTADSSDSKSVDLLIIHQKHGVMVGVVKTVSDDDVRGQDNQDNADEMIILEVKEGLQQLEEAVCTINHLTSDFKPVKVRKALMMPRLSRSSLKRAVASRPDQVVFACAMDPR